MGVVPVCETCRCSELELYWLACTELPHPTTHNRKEVRVVNKSRWQFLGLTSPPPHCAASGSPSHQVAEYSCKTGMRPGHAVVFCGCSARGPRPVLHLSLTKNERASGPRSRAGGAIRGEGARVGCRRGSSPQRSTGRDKPCSLQYCMSDTCMINIRPKRKRVRSQLFSPPVLLPSTGGTTESAH